MICPPVVINPGGTLQTAPLADVLRRLTAPERKPRAASRPKPPKPPKPARMPKAPRFVVITPELEAEIVRVRRGGMSVAAIAGRFGIGVQRLYEVLKPYGLNSDPKRGLVQRHADEILARIAGGEMPRTIALDLGISEWSVNQVRKGAGWPAPRNWTAAELAALDGAVSRRDGLLRFREALPRSARTDAAIVKMIAKRHPELPGGWGAARSPDARRLYEAGRRYREAHREAERVRHAEYRAAHREELKAAARAYRARKTAEARAASA